MEGIPRVRLNTGRVVANFSSPHPFKFETGEVLDPCSAERAKALMLESQEIEHPRPDGDVDIELSFTLSESVRAAVELAEQDPTIDIVLVPFPVMTALKAAGRGPGKCRVIRTADRVTKTVCSSKWCV